MGTMRIELTKLTDDRHRFAVMRADGARDEVSLEVVSPYAPDLVDAAFVARLFERLRRVTGQWQTTPFHVPMTLWWPSQHSDVPEPPDGRPSDRR